MNEPTNNPFAPPGAEVADIALGGPQLASRWARLGAALIDALLQFGVFWLLSLVTSLNLFDGDASFGRLMINGFIGWVIFMLINAYLLVTRGQTVGKILLGLRIVRLDGGRADAVRVLGLRYTVGYALIVIPVVGMLYALIDCLLIFRASRRCLHDVIADTIVVK